MTRPVILLTRPEASSRRMAALLAARFGERVGFCISPVMEIVPDPRLPALDGIRTLIFTSANGVAAYVSALGPKTLPCYTVGDATARAAQEAGLKAISAGGDAEALIKRIIHDGALGPMLHLRGAHARGDIAERLSAQGCPASQAIVYSQSACPLTEEALALLQGQGPVILPLFSPRSAALMGDGPVEAPVYVVAMSQNVVDALRFEVEHCVVAAHPDFEAVTEAIGALLESSPWAVN
ncbi:MAG: uroporphyrinogen-III synthase [Paracoccaceae bacterium]|nr:uroporphyrinogen-III synthase [Paracoccaceae bacterium]